MSAFENNFFDRSRQFFKQLWNHQTTASVNTQDTAFLFLEQYHSRLFPKQTLSHPTDDSLILPLKVRTTEIILKQVHLYYLPYRLESLLAHCDPFTAVATFLKALNFSYDSLLQNQTQRELCQNIFKELMEIDQWYQLESTGINELPLYEAAATHDLSHFQKTNFAFKRALDIIDILDQLQPPNYHQQKQKLLQFWHQQKIQYLEKLIKQLSQ